MANFNGHPSLDQVTALQWGGSPMATVGQHGPSCLEGRKGGQQLPFRELLDELPYLPEAAFSHGETVATGSGTLTMEACSCVFTIMLARS